MRPRILTMVTVIVSVVFLAASAMGQAPVVPPYAPPTIWKPETTYVPYQLQETTIRQPVIVRPLWFFNGYRVRYLPPVYEFRYAPQLPQPDQREPQQ